jgi:hypothetical protein
MPLLSFFFYFERYIKINNDLEIRIKVKEIVFKVGKFLPQ